MIQAALKNNVAAGAVKAFGMTLGALTLASAGLSAWYSITYWGYLLTPPVLPQAVGEFDEILSVTAFDSHWETDSEQSGENRYSYRLAPEKFNDRTYLDPLGNSGYLGTTQCNIEYCHPSRVLVKLVEQGTLTGVKPTLTQEQLIQVTDQLLATDLLLPGEGEYNLSIESLGGLIVEATNDGKRYLFFAVNGGQVENDHYPHYQMLFQQDSLATPLTLVEMDQFFYDISGLEGFNFWIVWLGLSVLSSAPSAAIALLSGLWIACGNHRAATA